MTYLNGDKYVGPTKAETLKHGKGEYFFSDGAKYIGQYVDDKRCGEGTLTRACGDKYRGSWLVKVVY